jgi:hypothetical protein
MSSTVKVRGAADPTGSIGRASNTVEGILIVIEVDTRSKKIQRELSKPERTEGRKGSPG